MSAVEESLINGHTNGAMSDHADTPDGGLEDSLNGDDGDLFGDDDEQPLEERPSQRKLDDSELDSGDDEGRPDRVAATIEDDEDEAEQRPAQLLSADVARVNYPEGDELYMLSMPDFLAVKHRNFDYATYEPPTLPHDGDPNRKFSPFSAAMTSAFWRRDPKNPQLLQSNARIVRWSDGSLTLQLATKPTEQYRIETKPVRQAFAAKQKKQPLSGPYDPSKDSHMFLAAAHQTTGVDLQIIQPVDATMKILPTKENLDESMARLKTLLAANQEIHDPLARLKTVEEDPELAKRSAEAFEKEKLRTARKREAAEDRLLVRRDRVLGRSGGAGYGRSAGLSVAGLEADDDGMPSTRTAKGSKRRKPNSNNNRRGDIYSDDEDPSLPRHRTREDEYDREDDFLADSDEEPEMYDDGQEEDDLVEEGDDDDPDKDDLEIEGTKTVLDDRTRGKKSSNSNTKRSRMDEIELQDDDAEGEEDTEMLAQQASAGGRKRRVIDDDDEDE